MTYMTIQEASKKWGITPRRIEVLCAQERIPGTTRFGKAWAIPSAAKKPQDARIRSSRIKVENKV